MGSRNRSTMLNRELSNLDKDLKTRKSAMKALKSYVESMDSGSIPLFLSWVSETKETGSLSGEYTISLCEVLARVHGVKTVPHFGSIMKIVIRTLSASAGSFPLQQACSKVVLAFARYGIEPGTSEEEKRRIFDSILSPLVESLVSSQECLSSGAAVCLKALVESDKWRFASHVMANKVCQNVAVAVEELEKAIKSNSHMALVMSLSKRAPSFVEAYARLFVKAGVTILNAGRVHYRDSQKRLLAIQMVDFMMKCLDRDAISPPTLDSIVKEMENCLSDKMAWVREAALEALQTAKKISEEALQSEFDKSSGSVRGRSRSRRRNLSSQESQTFDSCIMEYDSMVESPLSRTLADSKLCSSENGRVDVSLRDGLFSVLDHDHGSPIYNPSHRTENDGGDYAAGEFTGFSPKSPRNGMPRSCTPSPQKSRSNTNGDNFATPKTIISSLQHPDGTEDSEFDENQNRMSLSRTPCSCNNYSNCQTSKFDEHGFDDHNVVEHNANENREEPYQDVAESVSSTDDVPPATDLAEQVAEKQHRKGSSRWLVVAFVFSIFSVIFASLLFFFDGSEQGDRYLPPT